MTKIQPSKFNLEERTFEFAKATRDFCNRIKKTLSNNEYVKQLVRSSSSVGANYIEANESFSRKDYLLRVKISRKEAKETLYWLRLLEVDSTNLAHRNILIQEGTELMRIFGAIIERIKAKEVRI